MEWGACGKGPDLTFPLEEEWENPLEKISFPSVMGVKFKADLVKRELTIMEF